MKRVILGQSLWFHRLTYLFTDGRLAAPLARIVASLTLKLPGGWYPHQILSMFSLVSIFLLFSSWIRSLTSSPRCHSMNHSSMCSQKSLTFPSPPFSSRSCRIEGFPSPCKLGSCCQGSLKKYASSPLPISQKLCTFTRFLFALAAF